MTAATPSVFVTARSATGVIESVSEALAGDGSIVPEGGSRVATLAIEPEVPAVPETVKVTEPPEGRVGTTMPVPCIKATVVLGTVGQTAPPTAEPQVTEETVRLATAGSLKTEFEAADGPALEATIV